MKNSKFGVPGLWSLIAREIGEGPFVKERRWLVVANVYSPTGERLRLWQVVVCELLKAFLSFGG